MSERKEKSTSFSLQHPLGRPAFHKHNTVDNLFASFYGFRVGRLLVEVGEARGVKQEVNFFCEVVFGTNKEKTSIVPKGEKPVWNEEFSFEVDSKADIKVTAFHASKKIMSKPKSIGTVTIPLNKLLDGDIHADWHPLQLGEDKGTNGELFLRLQYTSEMDRNRDYIIAKDNKAVLMKVLLHHDLVLICVLCKSYETEELSKAVIRLFNSEGQSLRLLIQLMFRDLKNTPYEDVLFRNDTIATKTTRNYFRMIGLDFVHHAMGQLIQQVIAFPKGYEVDPSKMKPEELKNLKQNQHNLASISTKFLNSIYSSIDRVPLNMRKYLNLLRTLVKQVFPQKELRSIGSILFLRFLVPAITAPQSYDIVTKEVNDPDARRALTLIAKMIQNLANEILEFKEECMIPMNYFLSDNIQPLRKYFDEVSTVPEHGCDDAKRPTFTDNDRLKCLALIVGIMVKNLNNFEQKLMEDPRMKDEKTIKTVTDHFHELKEVLEKPVDALDVRGKLAGMQIK